MRQQTKVKRTRKVGQRVGSYSDRQTGRAWLMDPRLLMALRVTLPDGRTGTVAGWRPKDIYHVLVRGKQVVVKGYEIVDSVIC